MDPAEFSALLGIHVRYVLRDRGKRDLAGFDLSACVAHDCACSGIRTRFRAVPHHKNVSKVDFFTASGLLAELFFVERSDFFFRDLDA